MSAGGGEAGPAGTWRSVPAEAVRELRARWVSGALVAVLAGMTALVALSTAGRSDASRQAVLDTVDGVGAALLVVSDTGSEPVLDGRFVRDVQALSGVAWAFGLGPVTDVGNAALSAAGSAGGVPMRPMVGGGPSELPLRAGRAPRAGEVWLGDRAQDALQMSSPVGGVAWADRSAAVVGRFGAEGPLDRLADFALQIPEDPDVTRVLHVYVRAAGPADVPAVERQIRLLVPAEGVAPGAVVVETATGVLALREALASRLDQDAVALLGTVLGTGLALAFVVTWMSASARRTDVGRRRALGATRSAIVALDLTRTGLAALAGAVVGAALGAGVTAQTSGTPPSGGFLIALTALTVLSVTAGAVVPALAAARADPVRVLRVP